MWPDSFHSCDTGKHDVFETTGLCTASHRSCCSLCLTLLRPDPGRCKKAVALILLLRGSGSRSGSPRRMAGPKAVALSLSLSSSLPLPCLGFELFLSLSLSHTLSVCFFRAGALAIRGVLGLGDFFRGPCNEHPAILGRVPYFLKLPINPPCPVSAFSICL